MTPNPITVSPNQTLPEAVQQMKAGGFRRLPVMEQGQLVGIITDRDCKEAMPSDATSLSIWEINYLLARLKIDEIMSRSLVVVQDYMPLTTAAHLMLQHRIGGLPVLDDKGLLVGILTVTDVLKAFLQRENQMASKAPPTTDSQTLAV
jgi:acetoin utilization protein AcuB